MFIGVDVGGSGIRIAKADSLDDLNLSNREVITKPTGNTFAEDIDFITSTIRNTGGLNLKGIGIGVTGTVDAEAGKVIDSVNNPHWNNQPLVETLKKEFDCPVVIDNDAVAGAMAEASYGDTGGNFSYLVWGTGIGGVLVSVNPVRIDNINARWHDIFEEWHDECSGGSIVRAFGVLADNLSSQDRQKIFNTFISHLAKFSGDFDASSIVLAGGVAGSFRAELEARPLKEVDIKLTSLGDLIGVYGGFAVLRQKYKK